MQSTRAPLLGLRGSGPVRGRPQRRGGAGPAVAGLPDAHLPAAGPCRRRRRQRPTRRLPICSAAQSTRHLVHGPTEPSPDYSRIDLSPANRALMSLFKSKMEQALGERSDAAGYKAVIALTRRLNSSKGSPLQVQALTLQILRSLFPSWLPGAFKVMFSVPMPGLSCRLNAWVTALTCQWLMGPCKVNEAELDCGTIAQGHGVKVERCRYLEETGCVSVCLNSCKLPTQEFFAKDMGIPLTMAPDYNDFSCQFSFGRTPPPPAEDDAFVTPCLARCPVQQMAHADRCAGATMETT